MLLCYPLSKAIYWVSRVNKLCRYGSLLGSCHIAMWVKTSFFLSNGMRSCEDSIVFAHSSLPVCLVSPLTEEEKMSFKERFISFYIFFKAKIVGLAAQHFAFSSIKTIPRKMWVLLRATKKKDYCYYCGSPFSLSSSFLVQFHFTFVRHCEQFFAFSLALRQLLRPLGRVVGTQKCLITFHSFVVKIAFRLWILKKNYPTKMLNQVLRNGFYSVSSTRSQAAEILFSQLLMNHLHAILCCCCRCCWYVFGGTIPSRNQFLRTKYNFGCNGKKEADIIFIAV